MSKERRYMTDEERETSYKRSEAYFRSRARRSEYEARSRFVLAVAMAALTVAIEAALIVYGTPIGIIVGGIGFAFSATLSPLILVTMYRRWHSEYLKHGYK